LRLSYKKRQVTIENGSEIMVTKGQRRLGRTIRTLENSVELSPKESIAKESEKKYKQTAQANAGYSADSPVQNLRDTLNRKKNPAEQ
jgi:hypothetical protein